MPKLNKNALEETNNILETLGIEAVKASISVPILFCGVNRKVNTGNFENLDVFAGLGVPVISFPWQENFKEAVADAAQLGFSLTSKEAGERYNQIKELQSGRK
jgi:hypothetical protein